MVYGYAGKILRIDLSSGKTGGMATADYTEKFFGGRGIAARIYWDEVRPSARALDPENRLIFMTGPLAGFPSVGGSRWQVCAKSIFGPREHCSYSNLGGSWGAWLKFAGYDGLVIEGQAEKPVFILIDDGQARVLDGASLWGRGSLESRRRLKEQFESSRVLTIGQAGENMASLACILAENDSNASGGLGAVMGSKKLKAIVVRGNRKVAPADGEKLDELIRYFNRLKADPASVKPKAAHSLAGPRLKRDYCFGCVIGCGRATYQAEDGRKGKFMCQASFFYEKPALKYYGKVTEVPFYATRLCDDYGICTKSMEPMIVWLQRCFEAGLLTEKDTALPLSNLGSMEFLTCLLEMIALRQGFGELLAGGVSRAAGALGKAATDLLPDNVGRSTDDPGQYGARLYLHTAMLHATEPARIAVGQLHEVGLLMHRWLAWLGKAKEEKGWLGDELQAGLSTDRLRKLARIFWGSEEACDFFSYEGKALAAKRIQDREYAGESLILCNSLWFVYGLDYVRQKGAVSALKSRVISAVTGKDMDEEEINHLGERLFNLQRAIWLREGHLGRKDDVIRETWFSHPLQGEQHNPRCLVPGINGSVASRKGMVVDRDQFERMKDEYYRLRGWNIGTGIPTPEKMTELGLREIIPD